MENKIQIQNINDSSNQNTIVVGSSLLFIALIAIGLTPIFTKFSMSEISVEATLFNRFWIATIVFGVWNALTAIRERSSNNWSAEQPNPYTFKVICLLLLMGSLFAAMQLLWAESLDQTSVANSAIMFHGLRSLFTALGGWLFLRKFFDSKFLVGMIIAIAGSILIGISDFSDSFIKLEGDLLSIISGIVSALYLLIMENILSKLTTKILMFWCCIISSLVTMTVLIFTGHHFFPVSWQGWLAVISLALFCQVIGNGLVTYSLNYFSSGVVAVTMLIDPVLSAIFAWILLSEPLNLLNGIFSCIVLLGIYLALSSQYALQTKIG